MHDDPRGAGQFGREGWVMLADEADCLGLIGVVVDGRCDAFEAYDMAVVDEIHESFAAWRWEKDVSARVLWLWLIPVSET